MTDIEKLTVMQRITKLYAHAESAKQAFNAVGALDGAVEGMRAPLQPDGLREATQRHAGALQ